MRSPIRLLILLMLAVLAFFLFREIRSAYGKPDVDPSKILLLFAGVLLLGVGIAVIFVTTVMPAIGDAVGNLFFNPNEAAEKDPHSDALSAAARGDYETAVEEYRAAYEKDPTDTMALSEIAKIQCDHLQNPAAAVETLEQALQREWPPDGAAFLSTRLVDVYWKYQHDAKASRALLLQIIEAMPETRHSANAQHRLQEIERQLALEG